MQSDFDYQNPLPSSDGRNNLISSMLYRVIFTYLIPVLVDILSANFQGTTEPLFKTHTTNMWSFLVAQVIYCFALAADVKSLIQQQNSSPRSGIIAITSGSVSAVSLVSTFLPSPIGGIILYIAWACAVIIVVYQYGRLFTDACTVMFMNNIWNWLQANNIISTTEQQGPEEEV